MFSRSRRIRPRHTSLPSGPQCTAPDSQHLSAEYRWLQLNTGSLISLTTGQSWFDIVSMKSIWLSLPNGWPSTVGLLIFVRLDNHRVGTHLMFCLDTVNGRLSNWLAWPLWAFPELHGLEVLDVCPLCGAQHVDVGHVLIAAKEPCRSSYAQVWVFYRVILMPTFFMFLFHSTAGMLVDTARVRYVGLVFRRCWPCVPKSAWRRPAKFWGIAPPTPSPIAAIWVLFGWSKGLIPSLSYSSFMAAYCSWSRNCPPRSYSKNASETQLLPELGVNSWVYLTWGSTTRNEWQNQAFQTSLSAEQRVYQPQCKIMMDNVRGDVGPWHRNIFSAFQKPWPWPSALETLPAETCVAMCGVGNAYRAQRFKHHHQATVLSCFIIQYWMIKLYKL